MPLTVRMSRIKSPYKPTEMQDKIYGQVLYYIWESNKQITGSHIRIKCRYIIFLINTIQQSLGNVRTVRASGLHTYTSNFSSILLSYLCCLLSVVCGDWHVLYHVLCGVVRCAECCAVLYCVVLCCVLGLVVQYVSWCVVLFFIAAPYTYVYCILLL